MPIRVVLIGFGYWGPNLARNVILNPNYELVFVVESDPQRRQVAHDLFRVPCLESYEELENDEKIDLVVIATRPASHLSIATHFMKRGCNLLITKPCCISLNEATELFEIASHAGVKVYVDYTYFYSPLIRHVKSSSSCREIVNDARNFTSYRTSLGIIQSDVDVVLDLAVHDISILLFLRATLPATVQCNPIAGFSSSKALNAVAVLEWNDGFTALIHVSWLSPIKKREMSILSSKSSINIDETNPKNPLQIFEISPSFSGLSELSFSENLKRNVSYSIGNSTSHLIEGFEPLAKQFEEIAKDIKGMGVDFDLPSRNFTLGVWTVVEGLELSLHQRGARVEI
jgi:predicted dehydrogenase